MALYRFAQEKGDAKTGYNPFACTKNPAPRKKAKSKGQRIPDAHLALIWQAAGKVGGDYALIVRLAILLGVRISEIAGIKRSEINFDTGVWDLPADRHKVHVGYKIPLPKVALAMLREAAARSERKFLFGSRSPKGFAVASHYGARLKAELETPIPYFRPHHDFRHTFRSGIVGLGVTDKIAELAIGHAKKDDLEGYDHNLHLEEKRAAFEAWAAHVERLVGGNVVKLRAVA